MDFSMSATGIDGLATDLATAAATAPKRAKVVVDRTKGAIKDTAIEVVPVREGVLRDSIRETEDGVEATAAHADDVEFGTYKDSPQPYMGPATDEHEDDFADGLADVAVAGL